MSWFGLNRGPGAKADGPGIGHMLKRPIPIASHGPGNVPWTTYNLKLAVEKSLLNSMPIEAILEVRRAWFIELA
jgi:hypothetical protein